jgi:hypothetical protein
METNSELCKHFQRPSSYQTSQVIQNSQAELSFASLPLFLFWVQTKTVKIKIETEKEKLGIEEGE